MSNLEAANLFSVKGMVFVVTGGGSGIGAMMARSLDANGAAKVYIIGRRKDKLEEVATSASNASIIPIQGDASSKDSLASIASHVSSETPFVNAVIANHGSPGPTHNELPKNPSLSDIREHLWKVPMEEFNDCFMMNSTSVIYCLLAFLPLLEAGNTHPSSPAVATGVKSQIIATSSINSFSRKMGQGFAYSGSKAGVVHMMKCAATFFAPYGIRANVVSPGIYPSDMSAAFLEGKDATKMGSIDHNICPLTRIGNEEDMAGATLFLCSKAGAYVNGLVINTDGGRLSIVPATY
ncbi:short chain dehydrogenase/reductase family [Rhizodiscina lignyota]|uniref:Short chain dehydrogenase/reductase family n=1 Tax=Rhizodiscina lignyota TaxID=1504668 RepID=A0A9P4IGM7_9PEZI|nr:short chain dehydrogenase/reductase family [Rhizodiscina lignyota]